MLSVVPAALQTPLVNTETLNVEFEPGQPTTAWLPLIDTWMSPVTETEPPVGVTWLEAQVPVVGLKISA